MIQIKNKIRPLNDIRSKKVLEDFKTDILSTVIIGFFTGRRSGIGKFKIRINNSL